MAWIDQFEFYKIFRDQIAFDSLSDDFEFLLPLPLETLVSDC